MQLRPTRIFRLLSWVLRSYTARYGQCDGCHFSTSKVYFDNMHAPLDRPHPDCQAEIKALLECHENNPYAKFFGACGDVKTALDHCFKNEKIRMRSENFKHAKASDAYVRQKMQERRDRVAAEEKAREEANKAAAAN
ncbi:hypothetical protein PC118_g12300 [Phytophthora cactorum]|uniref:COX assembly mitochondrial protein n=3 Tax=Phytophthora TaxID=4783 RepID=A0A8T1FXQ8_9STRA|nr:hypothetical protein PC118_g12300 [Phytophthora cactorum]